MKCVGVRVSVAVSECVGERKRMRVCGRERESEREWEWGWK